MPQDSRDHAHGFGRAGPHPGAGDDALAIHEAALGRELGVLTTEIKHLNRSLDTLNARLTSHQVLLDDHGVRLVRLEQGPTRDDVAAVGARLTVIDRKVAVIIGVAVALSTIAQVALGALRLVWGGA